MPVLLLAYGDPEAKKMLIRAIESRYGVRPPVIDSLTMTFKGKARTRVGPVQTWVPVDAMATFRFPHAMRWDFTVKPLGLPVQRGVEVYHDGIYQRQRGGRSPVTVSDDERVAQLRRRLWGIAALLLTPLGDSAVKLACDDAMHFLATNTALDDTVRVGVRDDHSVAQVSVDCLNPDTDQHATFSIDLAPELVDIDELMLPAKLTAAWDGTPTFELTPQKATLNPAIEDAIFRVDSSISI